jgi:transposase
MRKLSEKQWAIIEPLLPRQNFSRGGRPRADDRKTIEGIIWILRTGAQWDELPTKYGSPATCWRRLRDWEKQGVWKKIWKQVLKLLDEQDKIVWEVTYMDATFAPAKKGGQKLVLPGKAKVPR